MRFILENADIYATNLKYMNDSEEYVNGIYELSEIFNGKYPGSISAPLQSHYAEETPESYSISFSTERDLLSQWSMYAKESGVSLRMEFDKDHIYEINEFGKNRNQEKIVIEGLSPRKVYYCTKNAMTQEQYTEVRTAIEGETLSGLEGGDISDIAQEIWLRNVPYIKRYEFKAEGEYRLVFNQKDCEKVFRVDYRSDKNVLKPYLDVTCKDGWPVSEIIVGPGFNQHQVFESICHFLQNAQLKLPVLSDAEFQERCQEYLGSYLTGSPKLADIWNSQKGYLTGSAVDRYLKWCEIRKNLRNSGTEQFCAYLKNRFISRDGVLLTKSAIPYIF